MYVITDRCDRCGYCLIECALGAIAKGRVKHDIVPERCTECGACLEVCPVGAIVRVAGTVAAETVATRSPAGPTPAPDA